MLITYLSGSSTQQVGGQAASASDGAVAPRLILGAEQWQQDLAFGEKILGEPGLAHHEQEPWRRIQIQKDWWLCLHVFGMVG